MAYIFKQKLRIEDLVHLPLSRHKILIYEPEEYLAALYKHYLEAHNFDIKHCSALPEIKDHIKTFTPDLLILSTESSQKLSIASLHKFLSSLSFTAPTLKIITTGYNVSNDSLTQLMSAGVSSHLNRRLSRPQDLVVLVQHLLN